MGHQNESPSLWLDSPWEAGAPLSGDREVDVAVVGGGITGLAAAERLTRRGVRFVLLERGRLVGGASGRNAGYLMSGLADPYNRLITSLGRDGAREIWTLTRTNHRRVLETAREYGIECDYDPCGCALVAATPHEMVELTASAELLEQDGFRVRILDETEANARLNSYGYGGAVLVPDDAGFHPVKFLRGLARSLRTRGAELFEGTPVESWTTDGPRVRFRTPGGTISAEVAIFAANAYLPQICPNVADLLFPHRGQMCATAPIAERILPWAVYTDWGHLYFRQTPDGRVLMGGMRHTAVEDEQGYDASPTRPIQDRLVEYLHSRFPATRSAPVTHRWAGTMGFSVDGLPLVGPVPGQPRIVVAGGYTGHGMGMGFAMGEAVVDLVLDGAAPIPEHFRLRRFL